MGNAKEKSIIPSMSKEESANIPDNLKLDNLKKKAENRFKYKERCWLLYLVFISWNYNCTSKYKYSIIRIM